MERYNMNRYKTESLIFVLTIGVLLFLVSINNYLLFHSLVELYTIIIGLTMFTIAVNTGYLAKNDYLIFIGIAYGFIAFFDLLHTLSYEGINIFRGRTVDLPTQLWVIARYLEAISLLVGFNFLRKKIRIKQILIFYSGISVILFSSVFGFRWFPSCYVLPQGLTGFKIYSEYVIIGILILNISLLIKNKREFNPKLYKYMFLSFVFTILAELMFTLYINVYGLSNMLGHIAKFLSFYFIYEALIVREEKIKVLFDKILNVLLEKRDYKMAWIGEKVETKKEVVPIAQAGMVEGYLDDITITWDESKTGQGPTGRAIKNKKCVIQENIKGASSFSPWQEEAVKRDYVSSIALPIISKGEVYGALNIYSSREDAFGTKEVELLQEVANNIGIAIDKHRDRRKIEYLSFHDQLTGLYNRAFFKKELERLDTERQYPLTIVICDLNDLKSINDKFGHKMGDKALTKFAQVVKKSCRSEDIAARWGGDEFVLLFPQTDEERAEEIIGRIRKEINQTECDSIQLSGAFGYAVKRNKKEDIDDILKRADNNMYRDKKRIKSKS